MSGWQGRKRQKGDGEGKEELRVRKSECIQTKERMVKRTYKRSKLKVIDRWFNDLI